MILPSSLRIVEVGPRDGLQNESQPVSVEDKLALITALQAAGLPVIEAGAFVSPKWVPQMADTAQVMERLDLGGPTVFPALVPNMKGFEMAADLGVREIAVFAAASESFSQKNINASIAESIERFRPVTAAAAEEGIAVRGYVSCVLGCPYEGAVSPQAVADVTGQLFELGCYEVSLGDTIGVGTAGATEALLTLLLERFEASRLAVHFHDTYGQALANILTAVKLGIATVDASVAGLGGCPYAPGAAGNVATEDVLYLCNGLGIETGVDLNLVAAAGWAICEKLGREPTGRTSRALRAACTR